MWRACPLQLPSGAACSSWHVTGQPPDLWPSALTLAGELCSVDVHWYCPTIERAAVVDARNAARLHTAACARALPGP